MLATSARRLTDIVASVCRERIDHLRGAAG
jgi:hypothetical protein